MENSNSPNYDNAVRFIDDVYYKLDELLKSREYNSNAIKNIRQNLNDLANLLVDLQCQDVANELYASKNGFNVNIDNMGQFAVLVSNAKKSVNHAKQHIVEKKEVYFKDTDFLNSKDVNVRDAKLKEYFKCLKDKKIQTITFVDTYFQIGFVHGGMSCISETFINTSRGNFIVPSKDGNWEVVQLIGKNILSADEKENEVILKIEDGTEITVNTRLGPPGDTFHITIEGLPTLHF